MSKKTVVLACAACLAIGYIVATVPGFNPINPFKPAHDRPVLRLLSKVARLGLWVMVFAEPPRQPESDRYAAARADGDLVCHSQGW